MPSDNQRKLTDRQRAEEAQRRRAEWSPYVMAALQRGTWKRRQKLKKAAAKAK
jgi:hypothetical protein